MKRKNNFNYKELIDCANGKLFGEGNAKLPSPPMLMFDRIVDINENQGIFKRGFVKAELDVKDDLWFFKCHLQRELAMPGTLQIEAMLQTLVLTIYTLEGHKGKFSYANCNRPNNSLAVAPLLAKIPTLTS